MSMRTSVRIKTCAQLFAGGAARCAGVALLVAALASGCGSSAAPPKPWAPPAGKGDSYTSDGLYYSAWSPDHGRVAVLASGGYGPADQLTILRWDDAAAEYVAQACLVVPSGNFNLSWSRDGALLAISGYAGRIEVYETAGQPAACAEAATAPLAALDLGPAAMAFGRSAELADQLAVLQSNGTLMLWNPRTDVLTPATTGMPRFDSYAPTLRWSSRDVLLVDGLETMPSGGDEPLFTVWNARTNETRQILARTEAGYGERLTSPRWAPDGEHLVAARVWIGPDGYGPPTDRGPYGALVLYDATGTLLWEQTGARAADIAWRPDGGLLAVADPSWRGAVDLLELGEDGRSLRSRGTTERRYYQVAWPRQNVLAGFVRDELGQPFELIGEAIWWIPAPPPAVEPAASAQEPTPAQRP